MGKMHVWAPIYPFVSFSHQPSTTERVLGAPWLMPMRARTKKRNGHKHLECKSTSTRRSTAFEVDLINMCLVDVRTAAQGQRASPTALARSIFKPCGHDPSQGLKWS